MKQDSIYSWVKKKVAKSKDESNFEDYLHFRWLQERVIPMAELSKKVGDGLGEMLRQDEFEETIVSEFDKRLT